MTAKDLASAQAGATDVAAPLSGVARPERPAVDALGPGAARRRALLYGLMLLPILALCVVHWGNLPSVAMTDYAQYLMQADSFLRGEGIMSSRYIYTPLNPSFGPAAYPPGFPATVVPVLAVFGPSPAALNVLMIVSLVAFVVIVTLYFERRTSLAIALLIGLFTGLALESTHAAQVLLSDVGFCALLWATVLMADEDDWSWKRVIAVTALGFGAMSYRAAGVVLIPSLLLFGLINRRRLGARPVIPAIVWSLAIAGVVTVVSITGTSAAMRPPQLLSIVERAWTYRWSLLQSHLYPLPWDWASDAYHVVTVALTVVGLATWYARGRLRSFLQVFTLGYFGMLLVVWVASDRYLWPLYPVAIYGLLHGTLLVLHGVRSAWSDARRERTVVASGVIVAILATATAMRAPAPHSLLDQPDVQELFAHVRDLKSGDTPPRVAFSNARVLAWETGVHAMPLIDANPERSVAEFRRLGITHVIVGDAGLDSWDNKILNETVRTLSQHFSLEFSNDGFALYRFHGGT